MALYGVITIITDKNHHHRQIYNQNPILYPSYLYYCLCLIGFYLCLF